MEGDINSDVVTIRVGEPEDELTELTVSCTDKVGLGCDLASVVLEFGLNVVKGGEILGPVLSSSARFAHFAYFAVSKCRGSTGVTGSTGDVRLERLRDCRRQTDDDGLQTMQFQTDYMSHVHLHGQPIRPVMPDVSVGHLAFRPICPSIQRIGIRKLRAHNVSVANCDHSLRCRDCCEPTWKDTPLKASSQHDPTCFSHPQPTPPPWPVDFLTDGRWCHVVFWVETSRCTHAVSWPLLKERMTAVCPSLEVSLTPKTLPPAKQEVFLLQVRSADRLGLLNGTYLSFVLFLSWGE